MASYTPSMSDDAVSAKTGKTWGQWFRSLDQWGAKEAGHAASARWLQEQHDVSGWWSQTITVEYERARGLRVVGQKTRGDFEVSAQRSMAVPLTAVQEAWLDGRRRRRWLQDDKIAQAVTAGMKDARRSDTAMGHVVRFDVGSTKRRQTVQLTFSTTPTAKAVVRLQHTGIPSKAERDRAKATWSAALDSLKAYIDA